MVVHPYGIAGTHHGLAVDVDAGAFADAVADIGVGAGDYAFAGAGLITHYLIDKTFVVQVSWLAAKLHIGRTLPAFVHGVGDRVRHRHAVGDADIGQGADQRELGILGGGGFIGHAMLLPG